MKKRFAILLFFSQLFLVQLLAQEKTLSLENAILGRSKEFNPENLNGLQWVKNKDSYSWIKNSALIVQKAGSETEEAMLQLDEFNSVLTKSGYQPFRRFGNMSWISENKILFTERELWCVFNINEKTIDYSIRKPEKSENEAFSEQAKSLAFTIGNNIYFKDTSGSQIQLSHDDNKNFVNGKSVSRNEFGIKKGIFWSPAGNYIAYYRKDESRISDYPIMNIDTRIESVHMAKYPMAGMPSERVSLAVYDIKQKSMVYIENDSSSDKYLTCVSWSPDEKNIFIAVLNRAQNHMWLNKYDVQTGIKIKTLFEEENPKYVEPNSELEFTDNGHFIWKSQRDGFRHLYLYDTDGNLQRQLTKGSWVVTDLLGFDPAKKNAFFISTISSPLDRQVCQVNLSTGEMKTISSGIGIHSGKLSSSGRYLIDECSSIHSPREITLFQTYGKKIKTLLHASDPLKDYKLPAMEIFTLKSTDQVTDLYCRILKPQNFDPAKKYPVIIYVYGGPHAQMITNGWLGNGSLWDYYMAQKGYVVFTLDNRGSDNRGLEFENVIFRHLGKEEMKDQMKGIEYLKRQPWVDASRLGVFGWSYGGFMTLSLMVNYPGVFQVAVAGGPVTDWKYYEVMYGERYMDTPDENKDGYDQSSVLNKVNQLKGQVLLIHGTIDSTVVWQQSLRFIEECVKNGKQVDYFVYPGHEHNVRGADRVHLMGKVSKYFDDYLKNDH
jgi:dipeptidyl-peptidase-4